MRKCILLSVLILVLCGCGGGKQSETGFLSDYSRLQQRSSTSFRYASYPEKLGDYSKFIIDPVQVQFYAGSKAEKEKAKGKLKESDISALQNYTRESMVRALSDRYKIVYQSGDDVARIRVALTDLQKSKIIMNVLPAAKVSGGGLGAVSMEAEIIDSQSGKQIRAIVETQTGTRLSFDGLRTWGDAKAVIDRWAKELRKRVDEAHGY
jgi:hypothetical protein